MAGNFDFNNRYKFKLSRFNDFDKDAHIIDEELENYLGGLKEDDLTDNGIFSITKGDLLKQLSLSSFRPQNELNPKIWIGGKINSKVRLRLLDIADDFIESLNVWWVNVSDIILTGSLANYNWSRFSDFDLHILIDFSKVDERIDFVREYFNTKKNEWNNVHENLKIYGFPVEVYVQDTNEEHTASGVYSLNRNEWVVEPVKDNIKAIKLDKYFIKEKTMKYIKIIISLKKQVDETDDDAELRTLSKKVKGTFDILKGLRKEGLKARGEMHPYNVIYKFLRRLGYLDILLDLKAKTYDKLKSIG
jgi:predicted nucleotidyltransferase